jgi:hypothetical protein
MTMTIVSMTFLIGLALIIVAIFGGGLVIKEVKIPTLPLVPRTMSFAAGAVLIGLCLTFPQIFPSPDAADSKNTPVETTGSVGNVTVRADANGGERFLGTAIKNYRITVREVKVILRHLGKYNGSIDDEATEYYFQAVADFQIAQKIEADGYVGPVTYAMLREAWPDYFASKVANDRQ